MKKLLLALIPLAFVFLIVSFFIPVKLNYQLPIASTWQNIATALQPKNWTKWEPSVRQAWQKDSSACHIDTGIDIPGKKIRITRVSYLLYQLELTDNGHSSLFGLMITPSAGKDQDHAGIVWSRITNLFYKLFPFLEKSSFGVTTIDALRAYLEDNRAFYGFPIGLKAATDTLFLTQKADLPAKELFTTLPVMQKALEGYARQNSVRVLAKNISFLSLGHDSLTVMVGLSIDKVLDGDDTYNFRELPGGQALAVGHYQGTFLGRTTLYTAMEKYLLDHQLGKRGLPYETYRSPFPLSDTATIDIDLSFPVGAQ
jgi:hypothetical protein